MISYENTKLLFEAYEKYNDKYDRLNTVVDIDLFEMLCKIQGVVFITSCKNTIISSEGNIVDIDVSYYINPEDQYEEIVLIYDNDEQDDVLFRYRCDYASENDFSNSVSAYLSTYPYKNILEDFVDSDDIMRIADILEDYRNEEITKLQAIKELQKINISR